ncbi:MAG: hypothetical protein WKG00_03685 [Polyangiaceae bacterium]
MVFPTSPSPLPALPPLPVAQAVVVGTGARAPNGLTALQVAMSVRALKMDPRDCHIIDSTVRRWPPAGWRPSATR